MLAWLPTIFASLGQSQSQAANMYAIYTLVTLPMALVSPIIASKLRNPLPFGLLLSCVGAVGYLGILVCAAVDGSRLDLHRRHRRRRISVRHDNVQSANPLDGGICRGHRFRDELRLRARNSWTPARRVAVEYERQLAATADRVCVDRYPNGARGIDADSEYQVRGFRRVLYFARLNEIVDVGARTELLSDREQPANADRY
jgi:hypothetical protein